MPMSRLAPVLRQRLVGFLPVYKPSGLRRIDLLDNIRLTLAFELKTSNQHMTLDCRPRLRKKDAGIIHVAFGATARRDLGLWKHADCDYHVTAVLGERLPLIVYDGIASRPFDSVTPADLLSAMNSYSGEMAQVRIPLEPEQREQVTEKNKSISTVVRGIFYEGTQPHLVNLISIRNLNCDFPHFQFDLTVRGSFCVHRFVDDVGLKLGTFARVNLLDLIRFGDITVDDCLQKHQLYSEEIRQCLKKSRKKYKSIRLEYVSSKREPSHTSPW